MLPPDSTSNLFLSSPSRLPPISQHCSCWSISIFLFLLLSSLLGSICQTPCLVLFSSIFKEVLRKASQPVPHLCNLFLGKKNVFKQRPNEFLPLANTAASVSSLRSSLTKPTMDSSIYSENIYWDHPLCQEPWEALVSQERNTVSALKSNEEVKH